MTRLLVVSDSHGDIGALRRAVLAGAAKYGPADLLLHCGDGARDPERIRDTLREMNPAIRFLAVRGNCDGASCDGIPYERAVEIEELRLYMTHGHRQAVKSTHLLLEDEARDAGCSIALFGHTHVPFMDMASVLLLNPGCARDGHYLVLEVLGNRPRIHLDRV